MLLTAPVNETTVVLSKFFAALRIFLLGWLPWLLFLVALRVEGGQEFDYRPIITFLITMTVMAAGWLAMGLFFSSLTSNQIGAAVLTLLGMIALTLIDFFVGRVAAATPPGAPQPALVDILNYVNYLELWGQSVTGTFAPRNLLFHLSFAVFWLFMTVKVLEARKWR